nr:hypothetical protein GCM10020093_022890 [Planobispora longispora]
MIEENEVVLGMGIPAAVPWYGLPAWAGLAVTLAAAWRARTARASRRPIAGGLLRDPAAAHLLAAVISAGFLAWWHLYFL